MTGSVLELLIIGVIILGIAVAIWKGGSANPEGTRALGVKVSQVSTDVGKLSGEVGQLSTRVGHVEEEVDELKQVAATTKDLERIEERMNTVLAQIKGDRELADRTYMAVSRVERMLLNKGHDT